MTTDRAAGEKTAGGGGAADSSPGPRPKPLAAGDIGAKPAVAAADDAGRSKTKAVWLLVLAAGLWGLTFTAGKVASDQAGPLSATLWRFVLAGLALVPLALARAGRDGGRLLPRKGDWALLVLSGLTGLVLYNFFFIKALAMIPAGRGSVIVCGSPVLIYLGSVLFFGEKLRPVPVMGIVLSVLGTAWATSERPWTLFSEGLGRGDMIMLLCPLSWTAYSLLGKVVVKRQTPLAANAWSVAAAVAMLLVLAPASGEPLSQAAGYGPATWSSLAFLGLGGTALGFTFFYRGIVELGPHRAASFINLVPVFGILFGWLLLGERPGLNLLLGLALILAGIRLVQKH
ncbi:MAG: DMT family transporter [Deltaproteobacteria bacterium]|nr:DMT family transporter [Deltaproteobacteria bacterium]